MDAKRHSKPDRTLSPVIIAHENMIIYFHPVRRSKAEAENIRTINYIEGDKITVDRSRPSMSGCRLQGGGGGPAPGFILH